MFEEKLYKPSKLYAYRFDPDIEKKFLAFAASFRDALNKKDNSIVEILKELKYNPVKFCNFLCKTMSRDPETNLQTVTMFELMPRQAEVLNILFHEVFIKQKKCVFLKSRQQGASWMIAALFVHVAIFFPNQTLLMTSKDEKLLYVKGNMVTLMGKVQFIVENLPSWFKDAVIKNFLPTSSTFMILINRSTVLGQTGVNAGSGGTSSLGVNDEFDLHDNQQSIQAAMQIACGGLIYMSTLKTKGTLFSKMVLNKAYIQVRLSWEDDVRVKDKKKFKADMVELLGLETWNREYEMKHSEGDEDYLIKGKWIDAMKAIDPLQIEKKMYQNYPIVAGLDCAGQGKDNNVLHIRQGPFLLGVYKIQECFPRELYAWILSAYKIHNFVILAFDRIGVGYGIEGEFNSHQMDGNLPFFVCPVNSATRLDDTRDEMQEPVSGENVELIFLNLRARLWWEYRVRFEKTIAAAMEGAEAMAALEHELIFVQDERILDELQVFTYTADKVIQIISKKDLRKKLKKFGLKSPDHADADVYTIYAQEQYLDRLQYENRFGKH